MTEMERSPQEHAAHFQPEVQVVDEATTEEVDSKTESKEEDLRTIVYNTKIEFYKTPSCYGLSQRPA